jgi:hypothetical protein
MYSEQYHTIERTTPPFSFLSPVSVESIIDIKYDVATANLRREEVEIMTLY